MGNRSGNVLDANAQSADRDGDFAAGHVLQFAAEKRYQPSADPEPAKQKTAPAGGRPGLTL
jgi:hypothetical protein